MNFNLFKKEKGNKRKGFTLIEIMVAVSIFSIVMVMSMGALLAILGANRKAQTMKSVMNNLNFSLETMTRDLRFASEYQLLGDTITAKSNRGGNETGVIISYSLGSNGDASSIQRTIDGISLPITAPEIKIEDLNFIVTGEDEGDGLQPKILITIKGYAGERKDVKSSFNLQTTVSQRSLDD